MPELLMLISRTVPVTVSLTVPGDAEEETGLLDELSAPVRRIPERWRQRLRRALCEMLPPRRPEG